jgi:hypothetical protein
MIVSFEPGVRMIDSPSPVGSCSSGSPVEISCEFGVFGSYFLLIAALLSPWFQITLFFDSSLRKHDDEQEK